jgi:2-keto-4-pentenoate hydratase/2-oxohepta-3-ene-1,7-dioic acid hydratase in catechol pathway
VKLITFEAEAGLRLGSLTGTAIVDLDTAWEAATGARAATFSSMRALIDAGEPALDDARRAERYAIEKEMLIDPAAVRLAPPLPNPRALRCCSTFPGHYRNVRGTLGRWSGNEPEDPSPPPIFFNTPGYYKGNHLNITGPGDDICWPSYGDWLDFELELALVVATGATNIESADWKRHVFGWTIFNDVSARHPQIEEMTLGTGPNKGKDFDTGNIIGPCIVTADSFDGTDALGIARVNGEEWGRARSSEMAHDWGAILAHRSQCERLHPGEIIASGTFTDCSGIDHDRPLKAGDQIELEIEGIGILRNRVVGRP